MKLQVADRTVETNCVGKDISFRLDNTNSVIFQTLRSKMYGDPIGSCVREVLDNARDANREAGNQHVPIRIHLSDNYISIQDSGPGISPDRMEDIYCAYGASTKRNDNQQGGGFGLGAKSPFAYSDSFIIETVVEGVKYVYNAYIDESDIGKIKLVSEKLTDSDNGTTIKIPVRKSDDYKFRQAIISTIKFWHISGDAEPKVCGLVHSPIKPKILKEQWAIYNESINSYYSATVVVNGILYNYSLEHNTLLNKGLALIFNTGELELSSNREHIQQSDNNTKKIQRAIDNYEKELHHIIQEEINKYDNFDAVCDVLYTTNIEGEFEWKGECFNYPIGESGCSIGVCKKKTSYKGVEKYYYSHANGAKIINPSKTILIYDGKINPYQKGKVTKYARENKCDIVYIVNKNIKIPEIHKYTHIDDIKITKSGGKKSSSKPTNVLVHTGNFTSYRLCDSPEEIVWAEINNNKYSGYINICCVAKSNIKYLGKGWIHIDDYINRELLSKYTLDEIKDIIKYNNIAGIQQNCIKLKGSAKHLDFTSAEEKWGTLVCNLARCYGSVEKIEVEPFDFLEKYPILKLVNGIRWLSGKDFEVVKSYIKEIDNAVRSN